MVFNSFACLIFLLLLWPLYWLGKGMRWRQTLLIVGSLVFYGWWDWRFVPLMVMVSVIAWAAPLLRERALKAGNERLAKAALAAAIVLPLSGLCFFKYTLFALDSLAGLAAALGWTWHKPQWSIPLPVGISFYCFHAISYVVDVSRGKSVIERSFARVLLYIAFFPQLVAGPIVRSSDYLPQLLTDRVFRLSEFIEGLRKMLIGLLMKVVFSDAVAHWADAVFDDPLQFRLVARWIGALAFYGQIYFDFAGYSLMALGLSQTLGYKLPANFNVPYIARNVTEFWRRWHISLSSWLRDYLFIPLGGNRSNYTRNLMITMVLGGLWHGASWNFLLWGTLHGLALVVHKYWSLNYGDAMQRWASLSAARARLATVGAWLLTQGFVLLCWVPFRAREWSHTLSFFMITENDDPKGSPHVPLSWPWLVLPLVVDAWLQTRQPTLRQEGPAWVLGSVYAILFVLILAFGTWDSKAFIYFQF